MKLTFTLIGGNSKGSIFAAAAAEYLQRIQHFAPAEVRTFATSAAFSDWIAKARREPATATILLDSTGKPQTSTGFSTKISGFREAGKRHLVFSIGPADGWTDAERSQADLLLSLSPMTLPHQLAHVVTLDQVYRAFTIQTGHPYHGGH